MSDDVLRSTAASYDRIVESYEAHTACPADTVLAFRDAFVAALPAGAYVTDLGCGPGRDAEHFRSCGFATVAVDASMGMVCRAKQRGVAAVVGDVRRPPLRAGSYDGLWSAATLLHVPRAEVAVALAAWHEVLRPGGTLGLTTSLGRDEGWEMIPYPPEAQPHPMPLRRWFVHHDRVELEHTLVDNGFAVTESAVRESHRPWLQVLATRQP